MVAKSPEGIGANVKIFLGHFQKCLTIICGRMESIRKELTNIGEYDRLNTNGRRLRK